jgi:hypothetical protein
VLRMLSIRHMISALRSVSALDLFRTRHSQWVWLTRTLFFTLRTDSMCVSRNCSARSVYIAKETIQLIKGLAITETLRYLDKAIPIVRLASLQRNLKRRCTGHAF